MKLIYEAPDINLAMSINNDSVIPFNSGKFFHFARK